MFDGGSMVVGPTGHVQALAKRFEEDFLIWDTAWPLIKDGNDAVCCNELEEIYQALVLGTRDYVQKSGFKKVVIGMSGGIDSALTAAIAVDALGPENVRCITMPSKYNSQETLGDAHKQSAALDVECETIPIQEIFKGYESRINTASDGSGERSRQLMRENLQARIRGSILMAYSNATGRLVLSTGNKSEMSVGYCTLYGDMCGGFAVLKDVYKVTVFDLCRYLNETLGYERILKTIIDRPPSAELAEGQKDEDSLPPYSMLDQILEMYVEQDKGVDEISQKFNWQIVLKVAGLVDRAEYKRRQAAPGVKITPKAFGRDRRMPVANKYRQSVELDNGQIGA